MEERKRIQLGAASVQLSRRILSVFSLDPNFRWIERQQLPLAVGDK